MTINELIKELQKVPKEFRNLPVNVSDMEYFSLCDFEISISHCDNLDGYADIILPVYISQYTKDGEEEPIILY